RARGGGGEPARFAVLMMGFAVLCWGAARLIPPTGQAAPDLAIDRNILRSTFRLIERLRAEPRLWWGAWVVSWFWVVGAIALSLLPPLVKNLLGGTEEVVTAFLAIFSVAIAVASGLASWLAAGRIVLIPTFIGAVGIALFSLDLAWATAGVTAAAQHLGVGAVFGSVRGLRIAIDLGGLAVAGGLFIVPAFSAMQAWAGPERRARVIAANNVLNAACMAASLVVVALLQRWGFGPSGLFLLIGLATAGVAAVILR